MNGKAKIHVMIRIWLDDFGLFDYEVQFSQVLCKPELILELPTFHRTEQDWLEEIIGEINLNEFILPDKFEICEEPILYECIGVFSVIGSFDYWGEYEEEYDFKLEQWSCDFEDEESYILNTIGE